MSALDRIREKFRIPMDGTDKGDKSPSVSSVSPQHKVSENCTPPSVGFVGPHDKESEDPCASDDQAMERRRQRVLTVLNESPETVRYAFDVSYHGDNAIVAMAVRNVASFELTIPRDKFDPFTFLAFVQQQGAAH